MVLLTPRSASAVKNLTLFSHVIHIIARVCLSRHSSARGLPAATSLRQFLPAVGYALLPAVGPFFSRLNQEICPQVPDPPDPFSILSLLTSMWSLVDRPLKA